MKKKMCLLNMAVISSLLPGIVNCQTWKAMASMRFSRDAAVSFSIGPYGFCGGGGEGQSDFWKYNPIANTWTKLSDIPGNGGRGYAVGISDGRYGYVGFGQEGSQLTFVQRDWWRYDTATNTWTQRASLPLKGLARLAAGSFTLNGTIYIFGGGDSAYSFLHDCWAYDTGADKWTQVDSLPDYIGFPCSFSINGKGYFTCYLSGTNGVEATDTYMYDPKANTWTKEANFPGTARDAGAAFVLNNMAYVGLGQSQFTNLYNDFYSYNPVLNNWQSVDTFGGGARAWPSAFVVDGNAYIGTGSYYARNSAVPENDWWQFIPAALSVKETKMQNELMCYPVPATNFITIEDNISSAGENVNYCFYNMAGQLVKAGKFTNNGDKYILNVSVVSDGEYLLCLENGNSSVSSKKIVVLR